MSATTQSFLRIWWARLSRRAPAKRVPAPAAKAAAARPRPAVVVAPQSVAAPPHLRPAAKAIPSHEADAAAVEQSFLETVRLKARPVAVMAAKPTGPELREHTLQALNDLRQIPVLQSLAQGFVQAMGRADIDVEEIVESIQKDSALCVRVLGMANSVAVASEMRIEDLTTAVQMLGVLRVRRMAQAIFTLRDAQQMVEGLDWRHLWIHAFATAALAEELERRIRPSESSQVYLAALLHDVGKIVLSTIATEAYRDVLVASWQGDGRLEDLERERLGVDHREAGVMFAQKQNLPAAVIETVAHHDNPAAAATHAWEVGLVSVANFLSKSHGLGFSGARLGAADGEFEDLPAWKVIEEKCGHTVDVIQVQEDLHEFIDALRTELRGLRAHS